MPTHSWANSDHQTTLVEERQKEVGEPRTEYGEKMIDLSRHEGARPRTKKEPSGDSAGRGSGVIQRPKRNDGLQWMSSHTRACKANVSAPVLMSGGLGLGGCQQGRSHGGERKPSHDLFEGDWGIGGQLHMDRRSEPAWTRVESEAERGRLPYLKFKIDKTLVQNGNRRKGLTISSGENTFTYLLRIQWFCLNWEFPHMQRGPERVPSLTEERAGQASVTRCHEK